MIRSISDIDIKNLKIDAFLVRILSYYECYNDIKNMVEFWEQIVEGTISGFIARFEDKFTLYLTDNSDLEEISGFLKFQNIRAVTYNAKYHLDLHFDKKIDGKVLVYQNFVNTLNSDKTICADINNIKDLYELELGCKNDSLDIPEYLPFLSDVIHRKKSGNCIVKGIYIDDKLISGAITTAFCKKGAVIGGLCTHKDYRHLGYARCLLKNICDYIIDENKKAFVFSKEEKNTDFYIKSGFSIVDDFREIYIKNK